MGSPTLVAGQKAEAGGATSFTTATATLPNPAQFGNLLLAMGLTNGNSPSTQVPTTPASGSGFTEVIRSGTNSPVTWLWYKVASGGEQAVTLSQVNANNLRIQLFEFEGNSLVPLDVSAKNESSTATTSASTGTTAATQGVPGLGVAVLGSSPAPGSAAVWTNSFSATNGMGANSTSHLQTAFLEHAGGGTLTSTPSWTNASAVPRLIVANFMGVVEGTVYNGFTLGFPL